MYNMLQSTHISLSLFHSRAAITIVRTNIVLLFDFLQVPETVPFFINIFQWSKVPSPESDEAPIPVVGGPVYDNADNEGDQADIFVMCIISRFNSHETTTVIVVIL